MVSLRLHNLQWCPTIVFLSWHFLKTTKAALHICNKHVNSRVQNIHWSPFMLYILMSGCLMFTIPNVKPGFDFPQEWAITIFIFTKHASATSLDRKRCNSFIPRSLNQKKLLHKPVKFCCLSAQNSVRLPMTFLVSRIQFMETGISHLYLGILGGTLQWYKSLIFSPKPYLFKPIKN